MKIESTQIKATPRKLRAVWSATAAISTLKKDQEFVNRWLTLWTDAHLIMSMLNHGDFDAIERIDFGRLEEIVEVCPELAKKLAVPRD